MNSNNYIESLRKRMVVLAQRAGMRGCEDDVTEVTLAIRDLVELKDRVGRLQMAFEAKSEQFAALEMSHNDLLNAVHNADEEHPLVLEMAEMIRHMEWLDMEKDGIVTTNDVMLKLLDVMGLPISDEEAAEFAAWVIGLRGTADSQRATALAGAIRQFLMERVGHE